MVKTASAISLKPSEQSLSDDTWKKMNGVRREVEKHQEAIFQLMRQTSENFIQIGMHLNAVHELIGFKAFQEWMLENKMNKVFASRCMNAAKNFGDDEPLIIQHIQKTALHLLSRRAVPESARKEARRIAAKGQTVTKTDALEISKKHGMVIERRNTIQSSVDTLLYCVERAAENRSPEDLRVIIAGLERITQELRDRLGKTGIETE